MTLKTNPAAPVPEYRRQRAVGGALMNAVRTKSLLIVWVVLGSALSFGLEPMTGRLVLPKYGGSAHVWNVTMMIFQGLLLLGYAYAHGLGRRLGRWHLAMLAVPVLWLPVRFGGPTAPDAPLVTLSSRLLWHVGVPFWALTTTAIMAQAWWWRATRGAEGEPYPLYAASNIGSLVALLGYPLIVEPFLTLSQQRFLWSGLYVGYLFLAIWAWRTLSKTATPEGAGASPPGLASSGSPEATPNPASKIRTLHSGGRVQSAGAARGPTVAAGRRYSDVLRWLVLAGTPSVLLLAMTNQVASEVGSFPLVWVIPLALYLGSFAVVFREASLIDRVRSYWIEVLLAFAIASRLLHLHFAFLIVFHIAFFGLCCGLHRHLYLKRPHPDHLTRYYLVMAVGGWIGGLLVAVVAPVVFDGLYELPLATLAAAALLLASERDNVRSWWRDRPPALRIGRSILIGGLAMLGAFIALAFAQAGTIDQVRSFYGIYQVREVATGPDPHRELVNGSTKHGVQYLDPTLARRATSYYHPGGPIHQALALRPPGSSIGAIGLGAGVIAADVRPDERLVFYEIDPENAPLARKWFSYLSDSAGEVTIREGDARLLLETEADRTRYDVMLVDAFSGDGVPVHLMTREAVTTYLDRLTSDAILVFHISNRYSDLRSVLKAHARHFRLHAAWTSGKAADARSLDASARVVAFATRESTLAPLLEDGWSTFSDSDGIRVSRQWTDDYSNILLPILDEQRRQTADQ